MDQRFKGAIFDLDGTLLDSMSVWHDIDIRFLGKRGIHMPDDYQKAILNMHFPTAARYTIDRFHLSETEKEVMNEWTEMAAHIYHDEVQAKPGACAFVKHLKQMGLKLAVATSGQARLFMPCLERLGIVDDFSMILETEKIGCTKKDPLVYQTILDAWQIPAKEIVVFEDILMALKTAAGLGIYTVGVFDSSSQKDWPAIQKMADQTITDFNELIK